MYVRKKASSFHYFYLVNTGSAILVIEARFWLAVSDNERVQGQGAINKKYGC